MIVLIDNGHGAETPGKKSPDGRLKEWSYTRQIAAQVVNQLKAKGIDARLLVPEERDVPLSERCRRANAVCDDAGTANVILVSIHCNASGPGDSWRKTDGWSVFIHPNASAKTRMLATKVFEAAVAQGLKCRVQAPDRKYWTMNLAICRGSRCPAILTENLFQDNSADVNFLLSQRGRDTIARLHVDGITNYLRA